MLRVLLLAAVLVVLTGCISSKSGPSFIKRSVQFERIHSYDTVVLDIHAYGIGDILAPALKQELKNRGYKKVILVEDILPPVHEYTKEEVAETFREVAPALLLTISRVASNRGSFTETVGYNAYTVGSYTTVTPVQTGGVWDYVAYEVIAQEVDARGKPHRPFYRHRMAVDAGGLVFVGNWDLYAQEVFGEIIPDMEKHKVIRPCLPNKRCNATISKQAEAINE